MEGWGREGGWESNGGQDEGRPRAALTPRLGALALSQLRERVRSRRLHGSAHSLAVVWPGYGTRAASAVREGGLPDGPASGFNRRSRAGARADSDAPAGRGPATRPARADPYVQDGVALLSA